MINIFVQLFGLGKGPNVITECGSFDICFPNILFIMSDLFFNEKYFSPIIFYAACNLFVAL